MKTKKTAEELSAQGENQQGLTGETSIPETTEQTPFFSIKPAPVTLEQAAAKFENLQVLFARKAAFKSSLVKLDTVINEMGSEENGLETETARLCFQVGRYRDSDLIKITHRKIIALTVEFIKGKIDETLAEIEADIIANY